MRSIALDDGSPEAETAELRGLLVMLSGSSGGALEVGAGTRDEMRVTRVHQSCVTRESYRRSCDWCGGSRRPAASV